MEAIQEMDDVGKDRIWTENNTRIPINPILHKFFLEQNQALGATTLFETRSEFYKFFEETQKSNSETPEIKFDDEFMAGFHKFLAENRNSAGEDELFLCYTCQVIYAGLINDPDLVKALKRIWIRTGLKDGLFLDSKDVLHTEKSCQLYEKDNSEKEDKTPESEDSDIQIIEIIQAAPSNAKKYGKTKTPSQDYSIETHPICSTSTRSTLRQFVIKRSASQVTSSESEAPESPILYNAKTEQFLANKRIRLEAHGPQEFAPDFACFANVQHF
ncbi:hypothetical protein L3Y34_002353 [Caenorhabditis briggsae]|uniref:Uncharacterized protein n=1 Tax=Caenorhabditis briggsae TaxID=6238 RepID=A0AAE9ISH6_CAEBR|nr:hypothetical protein L3Y34_002353 [Caenorhabditis briggsae]